TCKVTPFSCLDDQMSISMAGSHARRRTMAICRSACFDRKLSGTSCFCVSSCMPQHHARLHLLLWLRLSWFEDKHHVLATELTTHRPSRSSCVILVFSTIFDQ